MDKDRREELEKQIQDLKQRWPAHSVPRALLEQLDELEEALDLEEKRWAKLAAEWQSQANSYLVRQIGIVENEFDAQTAPDVLRSVESRIWVEPALLPGLRGLEPGEKILVLFYFHRSEGFELLQHPRGDKNRARRGVFSLRSPNRPTPLGVTIVDLIAMEGNMLRVRGLDAINGTPVLDIKPA